MKKVLLLISLIISSIVSAQVLVIDGTHHLISENTFPLYLNGGTQLDFFTPPVSLISGIEYNIVSNETGNDLSFNQVLNITEGSVVPENKVWKLVSMMSHTETIIFNDSLYEDLGGYVIHLDGAGSGVVVSPYFYGNDNYNQAQAENYCNNSLLYGFTDWVLPSIDQLMSIYELNLTYELYDFSGLEFFWSASNLYPNVINLDNGIMNSYAISSQSLNCICVRQF